MLRVVRTAFMLSAVAGVGVFTIAPAFASVTEAFIGHARFESTHSSAHSAIDPEVFIADENALEAAGALGISHIAGFRPARLADNQALPLYNAQGVGLSLSLGRWLGGSGTAEFLANEDGDGSRVHFTFTDLVPFGLYSVFVSHSTPDGTVVAPFSDSTNSMTPSIDGFVELSAVSSTPLENGDTLLLIYHSDGQAHGQSRGDLGITAHEQLVLPIVLAAHQQPADSLAHPMQEDTPAPAAVEAAPTATPSPVMPDENNGDDVFVPTVHNTAAPTPHPAPSVSPDGEPTF